MGNHPHEIRHRDTGNVSRITVWLADTYAGRHTTGLVVGDFWYMSDTKELYVVDSPTSMGGGFGRLDRTNYWTGYQVIQALVLSNPSGNTYIFSESTEQSGYLSVPDITGGYFTASVEPVDHTLQAASITSSNLVTASPPGIYRISYFLRCTTADVTAGTISASFTYTDSVGATTDTSATVALTSTANRAQGTLVAYLASGNITYLTTLIGIAGTSKYQLRARAEYLK